MIEVRVEAFGWGGSGGLRMEVGGEGVGGVEGGGWGLGLEMEVQGGN